MAWIEKRRQGWVVRWRASGGEKPVEGPYGSKAEAQEAANDFEAKQPPKRRGRLGGQRPVAPLTVAQVAGLWAAAMRDDDERMKRPGAATYLDDTVKRVIAAADRWGAAQRPGDITVERATKLRKGQPRTSAGLRGILRWAQGHLGTPFDPMVDVALRPPPSKRVRKDRLTDREARVILARARRLGQLPLVSCLMVYGWRPITATRINVGNVDLAGERIDLRIKHDPEPWWHPLFPWHVDMLRPLVTGRASADPLFVPPRFTRQRKDGKPPQRERARWTVSDSGSAGMLAVWIRRHLLGVGTNQLKKLAISRMRAGEWPWARPMDAMDVMRFTGQKSEEIVERYEQTNLDRARAFMARGQVGGKGA